MVGLIEIAGAVIAVMGLGVVLHHGLSTGITSGDTLYSKTVVSKIYNHVLPSMDKRHKCPRTGKNHTFNDHLGCSYFKCLDADDNVVCNYSKTAKQISKSKKQVKKDMFKEQLALGELDFAISPPVEPGEKLTTDIDLLAFLVWKHKKLVFDRKLVKYVDMSPKQLQSYVKCLERYKFIKQKMHPVHGLMIEWTDESDFIKNGLKKKVIKSELQNRKRFSTY